VIDWRVCTNIAFLDKISIVEDVVDSIQRKYWQLYLAKKMGFMSLLGMVRQSDGLFGFVARLLVFTRYCFFLFVWIQSHLRLVSVFRLSTICIHFHFE